MTQLEEDLKNLKAMNLKAIARQYQEMAGALRVIRTWAEFDPTGHPGICLIPKNTARLCESALRRFKK